MLEPNDAYVLANYDDLLATMKFIVGKSRSAMEIAIAYRDSSLFFIRGNSEARVPAVGDWRGMAYFRDDGLLKRLDHVSVSDNSIAVRVNAGRLVIGECVVPCRWEPETSIEESIGIGKSRREKTQVRVWDLKLVAPKKLLPSVEVDTGDDNAVLTACETVVTAILGTLPKSRRITIYTYESPSVNFGRQTNSLYFAISGNERTVTLIHAALGTVPGASVRFGEYLSAEQCVPRFHYEDGKVWRPEDDDHWHSVPVL